MLASPGHDFKLSLLLPDSGDGTSNIPSMLTPRHVLVTTWVGAFIKFCPSRAQLGRTQGSRHKICDKRCSIATNVVPGPVLSFPYTYIADAASLLSPRTPGQRSRPFSTYRSNCLEYYLTDVRLTWYTVSR